MSETTPTSGPTTVAAARPWRSRWVWLGPLLAFVAVIAGWAGWAAWKHHRFEKERSETPPHVIADLKLKLLWVPAGTFVMGTENEAEWVKDMKTKYNDLKPAGWSEWKLKNVHVSEFPATVVTLTKGFYLGETEVTQAQWELLMGNNPSESKGPNLPVEKVSWADCAEFCRKLTERERLAGRIGSTQVFRLPTEAEWEYACRSGSQGDYCFGNELKQLEDYAWLSGNSEGETHEVGTKRPNAWGVKDMHGNVGEWCADFDGVYPGGKVADPTGGLTGSHPVNPRSWFNTGLYRVYRGGSWSCTSNLCSSASRNRNSVAYRRDDLGFRLALGPGP